MTKQNIVIRTMDLLLIEARGQSMVIRGGEIDIQTLDRKDMALMELLADSTSKTTASLPTVDRITGGFRLGFPRNALGDEIADAWKLHCGTDKTATLLADLAAHGLTQIEFAKGASPILSPMEAAEVSVDPNILRAAYGTWHQHPEVPHADWQSEVTTLDTVQGYWEYVSHTLEARVEFDPTLEEEGSTNNP